MEFYILTPLAGNSRNAPQIDGTSHEGGEEGVEDRRYQNRAAIVRLGHGFERLRVRRCADCAAQGPVQANGVAKLIRHSHQRIPLPNLGRDTDSIFSRRRHRRQVLGKKRAARPSERLQYRLFDAEVLKERNDVRKSFVECCNIDIGGLHERGTNAVQQGMRRLMRNHVMSKTGKDRLIGKIISRIGFRRPEVSENQGVQIGIIEGVGLLDAVREHQQPALKRRFVAILSPAPSNTAPERIFKTLDGFADHRIHHLLMKAGIGFSRRYPGIGQNPTIV